MSPPRGLCLALGLASLVAITIGMTYAQWPADWRVFDSRNSPIAPDSVVEVIERTADGRLWLRIVQESGLREYGVVDINRGVWSRYATVKDLVREQFNDLIRLGGVPRIATTYDGRVWTGSEWFDGKSWHSIAALVGRTDAIMLPPVFDEKGLGYVVYRDDRNIDWAMAIDGEGGVANQIILERPATNALAAAGDGSVWAVEYKCLVCLSCGEKPQRLCIPEDFHLAGVARDSDVIHVDRRGGIQVVMTKDRDPIWVQAVARVSEHRGEIKIHGMQLPPFQLLGATAWDVCGDEYYVTTEGGMFGMDREDHVRGKLTWPDESSVGGIRDMDYGSGWMWFGGVGGVVGGRLSDLEVGLEQHCYQQVFLPMVRY